MSSLSQYLLKPAETARAGHARVHHAADRGEAADLETGDCGADARDPARDLVSRDARIERAGPLAAGGVQVGVADTTKENVDLDVPGTRLAAIDGEWTEGGGFVEGGVGKRSAHG